MALIATNLVREILPFGLQAGATGRSSWSAGSRARRDPAELLEARALAAAGLGALVALPFLLIASVALTAPLAAPAAIALGYLAAAHQMLSRRPGRAQAWSAAVLGGLLAWALVTLLASDPTDGKASVAALGATLAAPLFAVGPEIARRFLAPGRDGGAAVLDRVAWLDRLAPAEAVLLVDRGGRVLAATHAASALLELPGDAAGSDLAERLQLPERAALLGLLSRCGRETEPATLELPLLPCGEAGGRGVAAAEVSRVDMSVLAIRLRPQPSEPTPEPSRAAPSEAKQPSALPAADAPVGEVMSDLGEAVRFAVSRAKARAGADAVVFEEGPAMAVACDKQACRRIVGAALDAALRSADGPVQVAARRTIGAVVVLLSYHKAERAGGCADAGEPAGLRAARDAADAAGGAVLLRPGADGSVSVRLALPAAAMADGHQSPQDGAI